MHLRQVPGAIDESGDLAMNMTKPRASPEVQVRHCYGESQLMLPVSKVGMTFSTL